MKYIQESWTIKKLVQLHGEDKIILNPPYQRNPVWTLKAQKMLIETIKRIRPMPNFFVMLKDNGRYEMVDGQQRARTIIGYWKGFFKDFEGVVFSDAYRNDSINSSILKDYLDYKISVTVITELGNEPIEVFYALVNSSGLRLSRPELRKAEYYNTSFLHLTTVLADNTDFEELGIFSRTSVGRMQDVEFVSELVALSKHGFADKKEKVDELFEKDINDVEYESLRQNFLSVIEHLKRFDNIFPINRTRYKQKNDFYTLFAFLLWNKSIETEILDYFYKLLVKIGPYIRPSQEDCDPLMNYAYHCVTQSNSKHARRGRYQFFVDLLLNETDQANEVQKQIISFFKMDEPSTIKLSKYLTLNIHIMEDPFQKSLPLV
jgi:hypothetical protein